MADKTFSSETLTLHIQRNLALPEGIQFILFNLVDLHRKTHTFLTETMLISEGFLLFSIHHRARLSHGHLIVRQVMLLDSRAVTVSYWVGCHRARGRGHAQHY
jgi:hypothetical protein